MEFPSGRVGEDDTASTPVENGAGIAVPKRRSGWSFLWDDLFGSVFEAVAVALEHDESGVVEELVDHGFDGGGVYEDLGPGGEVVVAEVRRRVDWRSFSACGHCAAFNASHVVGPTTPSAGRPFAFWKAMTAAVVAVAKSPSGVPGL
jgi:hypothetical protein